MSEVPLHPLNPKHPDPRSLATTTNPHDKTKWTNLELQFPLTCNPEKGSVSIYSTWWF